MRPVTDRLYAAFAPRRPLLFVLTALLVTGCTVWLARAVVREDIRTMLPEQGAIADDFSLLRQAPFAQRLTITVTFPDGSPTTAAAGLAEAMRDQPEFTRVMTGPSGHMDAGFLVRIPELAPALLDAADLQTLADRLDTEHVRAALEQNRRTLLGPSGLALKNAINRDPLNIRDLILAKLAPLARFADVRIENGMFVSRDGLHALILADTNIPMTDSRGAQALMTAFDRAQSSLPPGAQAMLLSGHRHTLANAAVIKADLQRILPASLLALIIIFLIFLRSVQSILVFLVPVAVMSLAGAVTAAIYGDISGIVLGFGAVLLGISVDYALHVFLALRAGEEYAGRTLPAVLREVARPVTFGAMTSLAAFAALLVSDIPGIRQLAVFSMIGLGSSLLLSLFVLPHGVTPVGSRTAAQLDTDTPSVPHTRTVLLAILWIVLLTCAWWSAARLHINGDLRLLSYVPADLRNDEAATRSIWGGMREMAMIFTSGRDLDQARNSNDAVWDWLSTTGHRQGAMSIAPVWPGPDRQQANMKAWKQFWSRHGAPVLQLLTTEKRKLGYAETAFAPFADLLQSEPAPINADTIKALGMQDLTSMLTVPDAGRVRIMTLIPDAPDLDQLTADMDRRGLDARLVSGSRFRQLLGQAMDRDVTRFSGLALAAVICFIFLLFRTPSRTLLALLPVGTGIVAVMTVMALTGQSVNLFHIVSFPLIMGLSADYGIFMTSHGGRLRRSTTRSVLLSGLTTLAGFGVLTLARHPALHAIGLTVLTGISAAMLTARWGLPLLNREDR